MTSWRNSLWLVLVQRTTLEYRTACVQITVSWWKAAHRYWYLLHKVCDFSGNKLSYDWPQKQTLLLEILQHQHRPFYFMVLYVSYRWKLSETQTHSFSPGFQLVPFHMFVITACFFKSRQPLIWFHAAMKLGFWTSSLSRWGPGEVGGWGWGGTEGTSKPSSCTDNLSNICQGRCKDKAWGSLTLCFHLQRRRPEAQKQWLYHRWLEQLSLVAEWQWGGTDGPAAENEQSLTLWMELCRERWEHTETNGGKLLQSPVHPC